MARRLTLKTFETERAAEMFARSFDHARKFNRLPLLVVERGEELREWFVVNPDADAKAHAPRTPVQ